MNEELERLKLLAEKATPGPWQHGFRDGSGHTEHTRRHHLPKEGGWILATDEDATTIVAGADCDGHPTGVYTQHDADFIAAANPKTVLDLLSQIETWREIVRLAYEQEDVAVKPTLRLNCLRSFGFAPDDPIPTPEVQP